MTISSTNKNIIRFTPQQRLSPGEREKMTMSLQLVESDGTAVATPVLYESGVALPLTAFDNRIRTASMAWIRFVKKNLRTIAQSKSNESAKKYAKIITIVPTFETEDDIDLTIKSLLLQSRPIDLIVIVINGPGVSSAAFGKAMPFTRFPNVVVDTPHGLAGKVNTLNWAYLRYVHFGKFDFVLGLDADIEADPDMVSHLEEDLISRRTAGGVMARYGFKVPDDMKGKSRSLIYGQRHEFAMTGIKHQLKNNTSEILGGQATLFRVDALREAAAITEGVGFGPWDIKSKVEDAELTRTLQGLGYSTATSRNARAWTGLMFTPATLHKQRRKWQDGHLEDMLRDFRPWLDRRRWLEQGVLGWNLVIRILFLTLLTTSIALNKYEFHAIWLVPMGLSIMQSFLVALKIPDKRFGEIIRSLLFVPGEIYYTRTLSVWLDSACLTLANLKRDGWTNQALAEQSTKKSAHIAWAIIALAIMTPTTAMQLLSRVIPSDAMDATLLAMWQILTLMTITSVIGMTMTVFRILRNYRRLQP